MNMILDTMLSGPEAMLIAICLGFIFGMFYYVGKNMHDDETYDADYLDNTGLSEDDFIDEDDSIDNFKGIL